MKSGFNVPDPNVYFSQVESLLRRSLGVSQSARARDLDAIKPAPPVEVGPVRPADPDFDPTTSEEANVPQFDNPEEWASWSDMREGLNKAGGAEAMSEGGEGKKGEAQAKKAEHHDEL